MSFASIMSLRTFAVLGCLTRFRLLFAGLLPCSQAFVLLPINLAELVIESTYG